MNQNLDPQTKVKRPAAISPLRPEFDEFLHASIGEFSDQIPFSVLSALARQDLDPWDEAAELARLPRESAIARLTSLIATAMAGASATVAPAAAAARLISLLPRSHQFNLPSLGKRRPARSAGAFLAPGPLPQHPPAGKAIPRVA